MSLFITSLNSGSNGNCYYIGTDTDAVLVDAGISCRETEKRMKRLGLSMDLVRAIFVSHEHSDHITGLAGLSKKYQLPVYITPATWREGNIPLEKGLVHGFTAGEPIQIGGLTIEAFVKTHDAVDPHSFVIAFGGLRVGVFTDIGHPCERVAHYFRQCHAVFLESNYCPDMLAKGRYPLFLQRRISGGLGHLSNQQALELFRQHRGPQLSHLLLAHLSKNNNSSQLVEEMFLAEAGMVNMVVASRYQETPVFRIEGNGALASAVPSRKIKATVAGEVQLSLFQ